TQLLHCEQPARGGPAAVASGTWNEQPDSYNRRTEQHRRGPMVLQTLRGTARRDPVARGGASAAGWRAPRLAPPTSVEPGPWVGAIALFDGLPRTHDADAHGATTLLSVRKADFKDLLAQHVELYDALLRLNCRRLRIMFNLVEDLNTRPLSARLAKNILMLAKSYGINQGDEVRIGLQLAQEDLAQLVGASRQRVNQELKELEREGALRIEPTRIVGVSRDKLLNGARRY